MKDISVNGSTAKGDSANFRSWQNRVLFSYTAFYMFVYMGRFNHWPAGPIIREDIGFTHIDIGIINDVASETAKHAPDKITPFMSLHPLDPNVNDEYDRCVGDLGCKGIKLGPNYQDFDPTGPEAFALFARLEADQIPIVFHQGTSPMTEAPLTYAHPLTSDKIAMAFPNLTMVLAHLAHPWQADCLSVVRKHPNVWADVSAQFYRPYSFWQGMRLFHEWGATEKILFASDWPVTRPQDNIDHLRALPKFAKDHHLPTIPEEEIEGIINRDAVAIMGVD